MLGLALWLNRSAIAQEIIWERPSQLFWVTLGAGAMGSSEFFGGSGYLGMSLDSEIGLISLRTVVGATFTSSPTGDILDFPVTSLTDLGLLYGVCERTSYSILSESAGVAVVWVKKESTTNELGTATIGIPFEVQAATIPLSVLSIGVKAYGNLNIKNPFGGILVCFHFSAFRKIHKSD